MANAEVNEAPARGPACTAPVQVPATPFDASGAFALAARSRADASLRGPRLVAPARPSPVPMRPGNGQPLFVVHDASGTLGGCWPTVAQMRCRRPVWGLQAAAPPGEPPSPGRLEGLAGTYVQQIRRVQSGGPYALCGLGVGGCIALEIARRLHADGEALELVCLVGTAWGHDRGWRAQVPRLLAGGARILLRDAQGPTAHLQQACSDASRRPTDADARAIQAFEAAAGCFHPRPYDGGALVLICAETPPPGQVDPAKAWRRVARRGLDVIRIPGRHEELIRRNASLLAMHLDVLLTPFVADASAVAADGPHPAVAGPLAAPEFHPARLRARRGEG